MRHDFYNVVEEGKNTKLVCKECKTEVSAKVIRIRSHRVKCPNVCKPQASTKRPAEDLETRIQNLTHNVGLYKEVRNL